MSSGGNKNGGGGGGGGGIATIPAKLREIIQSLKEVVNRPEHEIYATLKECNMDPNETVNKLLSQDTFHEVKSKRERRKEVKETPELRSQGVSYGSNHGIRNSGSEHTVGVGRPGETQTSTSELGKPAYSRENGSVAPTLVYSSTSQTPGKSMDQLPQTLISHSNSISAKSKGLLGTGDAITSYVQPSPGSQPAWSGVPGNISMADIVRMGRPEGKVSSIPINASETSYVPYDSVPPNSSHRCVTYPDQESLSLNSISCVPEIINEPGTTAGQHVHHEEWPVIEQSRAASGSSVFDVSAASDTDYSYLSSLRSYRANMSSKGQPDEVQALEDVPLKILNTERNGSFSASSGQMRVNVAGDESHFDCDSHKDMNSHHSHGYTFERQEGGGGDSTSSVPICSAPLTDNLNKVVSSTAANFQQLSLGKEDLQVLPVDDNHAVMIPNHLQVSAAECSHLSFGTFKSGIGSDFFGLLASNPLKSDLEDVMPAANGFSASHLDTRTLRDEELRSMPDTQRMNMGSQNYDSPVYSQAELMKQIVPEASRVHQDVFPSSVPGYDIENRQRLSSTLSYPRSDTQIRDLSTFPSSMRAYSNSSQSNFSASDVQSLGDSDLPYSTFVATQSMPSKFSSLLSSANSSSNSLSEVMRSGAYSVLQPTSLSLPGTGMPTEPTIHQNLTMHSYSQPSLPMGHSGSNSMTGNPFPTQSYSYLSSASQQAYPGSSPFQSLAALESPGLRYTLPQYRNSASMGSLPQSAVNASGYGNFGNSTNSRSFLQNPSPSPAGDTPGYDDILRSLYKGGNQYLPLQQNGNSTTSDYGPGSRTLSSVPGSMYYGLQGQNQQQLARYRQGQQSLQHYGGLEYSNYLRSQTGFAQEQNQRQSLSDLTLNDIQSPSSKQSQHHFWQHSY